MPCQITVLFDDGSDREFNLDDADLARFDAHAAREWLGREFDKAGCQPANPMGKIIAADMVLSLARETPRAIWEGGAPTPWLADFLAASAAALGRSFVSINLAEGRLGF